MFTAIALFFCNSSAIAFSHPGHHLIGEIADELLVEGHHQHAIDEIHRLLGFKLAEAAKWPDCAKDVDPDGHGGFADDKTYGPSSACHAFNSPEERAAMADYISRNWDNCVYVPGKACAGAYHFTDIAIQRDKYDWDHQTYGAKDHDIVHALIEAIKLLQDPHYAVKAPFHFKDQREALLLIAHFVGDIHQPLHVGAVYLDDAGNIIDPDNYSGDPSPTSTNGGNIIGYKSGELHAAWDRISACWKLGEPSRSAACADNSPDFTAEAEAVPVTPGGITTWPIAWASESVVASKSAFADITFEPGDEKYKWQIKSAPDDYDQRRADILEKQIVLAGARLEQLLVAIWPDEG
jgi:hypothetical protein